VQYGCEILLTLADEVCSGKSALKKYLPCVTKTEQAPTFLRASEFIARNNATRVNVDLQDSKPVRR